LLKDIKNTLKQSAIYGLSRISSKLIGFILLPIITLNFSVAQYGVYVLTDSLYQILWAVFLFGLESGIVRWYLNTEDPGKRKKFLFSVTVFLFVLNLLLNLVVLVFLKGITGIIFNNPSYSHLVIFASAIATVEAFSFVFFLLLRIEEKARTYTIFSVLASLISLLLQVYFLQLTNMKLEGVFIARIIAPALILLMLLPYYIKHLSFGLDKKLLKELVIYSFPIMIASVVFTLLNQVDRYILGYLTNVTNVGIYGLAYNISGLISFLVVAPFSLAFTVLSWKKLNDANALRFYTKTITYLFLSVTYIAIIVSLFTPHLIKVFTLKMDYWTASKYVPWIALSVPFYGMNFIGVFSFFVTKKTKYTLYSYLIALASNVILNFIFIPIFSIYGAAFVNLASFIILNISIYLFSKSNYFFKYEWAKLAIVVFCYFIVVTPFFYFNFENRLIEIILKIIACAIFPFMLYLLNFYEPIEIQSIRGFLNKYIFKRGMNA
jgi:O-antigen/teichoic acid export membrane protein